MRRIDILGLAVLYFAGFLLIGCSKQSAQAPADESSAPVAIVADDLAQETLLRGFRALRSLSAPDKFGAWLCGIALRAALDWLKAKERKQVLFSVLGTRHDPDGFPSSSAAPDARLEDHEERRSLLAQVEALPETYRQVVMLYYYEDCTYRDLATLLGVSSATINARLTKARALLRQRLAGDDSLAATRSLRSGARGSP